MRCALLVCFAAGARGLCAPLAVSAQPARGAGVGAVRDAYRVRLAQRTDLPQIAQLVHESFAFGRGGSQEELTYASARRPTWLDERFYTFRLALDIERRMTPWDWARHAQLVAESESGELVGFTEVWGEDAASLSNGTAVTPQPVLFNLCVASGARRAGIAQELVARCEATARAWGDPTLYLKVRTDNPAAYALYEREGYALLETRPPAELAAWQERWKGGVAPLRLMSKPLSKPLVGIERLLGGGAPPLTPVPAKGFDEFQVSLESVLAYDDRDALLWFALLFARNLTALSPLYRVVPAIAAFVSWVLYIGVLRLLSGVD